MRVGLLTFALLLALAAPAAAEPKLVSLGNFSEPLYVTSPPNDQRLFVVEKAGKIQLVGGGTFLDISDLVKSDAEERGLLSMAFSPSYASDGLFYVDYTAEPSGDISVVQYRRSAADPNKADPNSARPLFTTPHAQSFHNGGQLQIGPDGMLYVSIGDNGDMDNAQRLNDNPYGKILRLNPATGAAASGNPHDRIWSYGLRNPWRFSFDRLTGDIAIGDVGSDGTSAREEINWGAAPGRARDVNFGWPDSEGFESPGQQPLVAHPHSGSEVFCAITGGYVVRDPGLPTLNGRYIYGDYCNASLWTLTPRTGAGDAKVPGITVSYPTSFGQDA